MNGSGGTYFLANPTAYTFFRHTQQMLPGIRRHLAHPIQELLMSCPILVSHGGNPAPARVYIRRNSCQLAFHVFIQTFLFLHIKSGQPVIYHQYHIDIGSLNTARFTKLISQFSRSAMSVAISKYLQTIASSRKIKNHNHFSPFFPLTLQTNLYYNHINIIVCYCRL